MGQCSSGPSTLVRVTVTSGTRSVDLVLPGAVPVAELVPEMARCVGLLDPAGVHAGHRLVTAGGRELAREAGLLGQGVEDGGLLTVVPGLHPEPPHAYDDLVEAMADVVERDLWHWTPESGRAATVGAAGVLVSLGAGALVLQRGSATAAAAAGTVALLLLVGGVVLSRARHRPRAAVVVASLGSAYAALAGLLLVGVWALPAMPVVGAGAGALVAGLVSAVALGEGRALLLAPTVVGAVLLTTCLVAQAVSVDPAVALT
ncbi:MAG TPA: EsaB/YukD family protein, partial [Nocardioides sp.]|nr:EsaB/YukD family protein [Nocardioides sp.]